MILATSRTQEKRFASAKLTASEISKPPYIYWITSRASHNEEDRRTPSFIYRKSVQPQALEVSHGHFTHMQFCPCTRLHRATGIVLLILHPFACVLRVVHAERGCSRLISLWRIQKHSANYNRKDVVVRHHRPQTFLHATELHENNAVRCFLKRGLRGTDATGDWTLRLQKTGILFHVPLEQGI